MPAVATFTYVAPGTRDKTGTVSLEARSKRGIGRAEVVLDTNARSYQATGGLDDFIGTGTICDLSQPFTISGTGVTVTFTPADDEHGDYTYTGAIPDLGYEVFGSGTYTVTADDTGGTIIGTGPGSVKTPLGTMTSDGTETYTLTPTAACRRGEGSPYQALRRDRRSDGHQDGPLPANLGMFGTADGGFRSAGWRPLAGRASNDPTATSPHRPQVAFARHGDRHRGTAGGGVLLAAPSADPGPAVAFHTVVPTRIPIHDSVRTRRSAPTTYEIS